MLGSRKLGLWHEFVFTWSSRLMALTVGEAVGRKSGKHAWQCGWLPFRSWLEGYILIQQLLFHLRTWLSSQSSLNPERRGAALLGVPLDLLGPPWHICLLSMYGIHQLYLHSPSHFLKCTKIKASQELQKIPFTRVLARAGKSEFWKSISKAAAQVAFIRLLPLLLWSFWDASDLCGTFRSGVMSI